MFGKGIIHDGIFMEKTLNTMRDFIEDDGLLEVYEKQIAPSSQTVTFTKALNRSVTGSMNDLVYGAKLCLEDGLSPHAVGFRLNETPLSALKDAEGREYANPREVFSLLADGARK